VQLLRDPGPGIVGLPVLEDAVLVGGGDYKPDVFLWLRLWLRLRQLHEEVSFKFLLQEAMLCGANHAISLPLVWATRGNGCLKGLQSLLQLVVIVAPSRFCKPSLVVAA
jgi:hypothetical protein